MDGGARTSADKVEDLAQALVLLRTAPDEARKERAIEWAARFTIGLSDAEVAKAIHMARP